MTDEKNLTNVALVNVAVTADDVRKYFCASATEKEVGMFLQICKLNNLNPFLREAYIVKYGESPATIVTGYEVYLKRAERSGKYGGFKVWVEGAVDNGTLKGCIEIYRKDFDKPLYHEVPYKEYVQRTKAGDITRFWKEKPETMIKKVAISQGFRFAYPDELCGMPYTADEIIDTEAIEMKGKPTVTMPEPIIPEKADSKDDLYNTAENQIGEATDYRGMLESFARAKKLLGDEIYYAQLTAKGFKHANEIKSLPAGKKLLADLRDIWKVMQ